MPELDSLASNARLLRGLIWAGVLLAPMAAAVVLLGTASNSVRFAVILIAVAVALIGASVLVRNDPVVSRLDAEDRMAEEVAALRQELRAEFAQGAGVPRAAPPQRIPGPQPPQRVPGPQRVRGPQPPQFGPAPPPQFASAPPPQRAPVPSSPPQRAAAPPPPMEESSFFADAPPMYPEDDPFAGPSDDFAVQPVGPPPMQPAGPPPMGSARPPVPAGGRAGVPAAGAAVRPPARTGPGMTTGGRPIGHPGGREPGSSTGGRSIAAAAVPPAQQIPRQRGAASMTTPSQLPPPRASASVRPGGVPFGPSEAHSDDFGASDGYAVEGPDGYVAQAPDGYVAQASDGYVAQAPDGYVAQEAAEDFGYAAQAPDDFGYAAQASGVYGAPGGGNTYGAPKPHAPAAGDDYSFDSDEYSGYGAPTYVVGQQGEYGYDDVNYGDGDGYGPDGGYDASHEPGAQASDPHYKARRHRPSANDTNVGSLSDFASYGGYTPDEPDERYVQGYAPPPRGRH